MATNNNSINTRLQLWILLAISILSIISFDYSISYPIKLFVVLLHEISHAIMTILTGGIPQKILIGDDLSGLTIIKNGNQLLIASAGYLGSLFWGLLLFLSAGSKFERITTLFISLIVLLSAVNLIEGGLQSFLSILVSIVIFVLPRFIPAIISTFLQRFIGLTSCLYVIFDIKQDLLTTTLRETDTQIIEYLTGIPAIYIGIIWLLLSVATIFMVIKFKFRKAN